MDVNSLVLFAHIVDGGNLSAAARSLNMTRSNVSRRLKSLEDSVKAPLLIRTTHDVTLTSAGKRLYRRARNILRETQAAESELCSQDGEQRGKVKITLPRSLANTGLAEVIVQFGLEFPLIELEIIYANQFKDLHSDRTDISIHISDRPIETAVKLFSAPVDWVVCASKDYLQDHKAILLPDDLYDHSIICYAIRDSKVAFWVRSKDTEQCLMLSPHIFANDLKFLLVAAANGAGVALMPRFIFENSAEKNFLAKCLNQYNCSYMDSCLYLQVMSTKYQTPAARLLAERLKTALKSLLPYSINHCTTGDAKSTFALAEA